MRITSIAASLLSILLAPISAPAQPAEAPAAERRGALGRDDTAAESLGWKLAVQAWTFRDRTAFEAIDTAAALGVRYMELYPGQRLSKEQDAAVGPAMTAEQRAALKARLAERGVRLVNFGVINPTNDEKSVRPFFEFARDMGIETLTCEPHDGAAWDLVERLCKEFGVKAACHNHPKPSKYWNPETVMEAIRERDGSIGCCADTGHWTRSGLSAVESLRKYEGRLVSLHFKDVKAGRDEPWGAGDSDARGLLDELRRQGFKGIIAIEYEHGSGAPLEENVASCIDFFDQAARRIAGQAGEKPPMPAPTPASDQ